MDSEPIFCEYLKLPLFGEKIIFLVDELLETPESGFNANSNSTKVTSFDPLVIPAKSKLILESTPRVTPFGPVFK